MALIDILPKFKISPLDISEQGALAVRKGVTPVKLIPKLTPTVTPESVDSTTLRSVAPAAPVPRANLEPHFVPLVSALQDSSVVNRKAQAALIAQMRLETGRTQAPAGFNYGNITTGPKWKGQYVLRGDTDKNNNPITQKFRSYGSSKEFLNDYLSVLKNTYPDAYNELVAKDFNIDKFNSGLLEGTYRYAEDPKYASKLKRAYSELENTVF